jgi:phospholipid/cholesterol/gamma-HCH transport system ATP-binding protein
MIEVEVKNVSKSFDDLIVLDNVSLNIEEGENVVIFGRSGSGKSVLLKCIVRLMEPDSGDIFIEGQNVRTLPDKKLIYRILISKRSSL